MKYNTQLQVLYNNDHEYRLCIRNVFNMDMTQPEKYIQTLKDVNGEEIDEETMDELLFDENTMKKGLEYIYSMTHNIPEFREIYELAAAKMISTNTNIGLSICFAYDYFIMFHKYLVIYLSENRIDETIYQNLKKILK